MTKTINIALLGTPNSGKTAIFNALTGDKAKTANYAGVTVEKRFGQFKAHPSLTLVDLPGTYSLRVTSPDEAVTRNFLLGQLEKEDLPHGIIVVLDATNLALGLRMVLELKELELPMLVAVNLSDVAKARGLDLDITQLKEDLGVEVIETVAIKQVGLEKLTAAVPTLLTKDSEGSEKTVEDRIHAIDQLDSKLLYEKVDHILQRSQRSNMKMPSWHKALDHFFLHPIYGVIFLLLLLFVVFQSVFAWAAPFMDLIENSAIWLGEKAGILLAGYPLLESLVVDGVIAGVGSVLVFLPQIVILFVFILLLEDSGYLSRAVFLFDHMMTKVGLSGRSFIPLLSSFACAIPGVMATRTIQNPIERLMTISVAPLMTCSARLPVYTLLIAAVIPEQTIFGVLNLQGLVLFGLYVAGIVSSIVVSLVLKTFFARKNQAAMFPLLLELQSYRVPDWRGLLLKLWDNVRMFLVRAGTLIFAISVILWVLSSFPVAPENATKAAIDYSFAGMLGHWIEPIFAPLGFSWEMSIALIPGMAAREVVVGALGTVYALSGSEEHISTALSPIISQQWGLATALSFLTWYIYAPQCLASLAVIRRETASLRHTLFITVYLFALAYVMSLLVYNLTLLLQGMSINIEIVIISILALLCTIFLLRFLLKGKKSQAPHDKCSSCHGCK